MTSQHTDITSNINSESMLVKQLFHLKERKQRKTIHIICHKQVILKVCDESEVDSAVDHEWYGS